MRMQAAAPAGLRNMQTPPRSAYLARNYLCAGTQASEQRRPHHYGEVALSSEPSVSSVSREWARERMHAGVLNVNTMHHCSMMLLAFAALCTVSASKTGVVPAHSFDWTLIPPTAPEAL